MVVCVCHCMSTYVWLYILGGYLCVSLRLDGWLSLWVEDCVSPCVICIYSYDCLLWYISLCVICGCSYGSLYGVFLVHGCMSLFVGMYGLGVCIFLCIWNEICVYIMVVSLVCVPVCVVMVVSLVYIPLCV